MTTCSPSWHSWSNRMPHRIEYGVPGTSSRVFRRHLRRSSFSAHRSDHERATTVVRRWFCTGNLQPRTLSAIRYEPCDQELREHSSRSSEGPEHSRREKEQDVAAGKADGDAETRQGIPRFRTQIGTHDPGRTDSGGFLRMGRSAPRRFEILLAAEEGPYQFVPLGISARPC